ncbi:MAG: hypothetical protein DMD85_23055, partial [Candidatus Rokuibacteriota bacterium]
MGGRARRAHRHDPVRLLGDDGRRAAPRSALQRALRHRASATAPEAARLRQRRPLPHVDRRRAPLSLRLRGRQRRAAHVEAVERHFGYRPLEARGPPVHLQQEVDRQRAAAVHLRRLAARLCPKPRILFVGINPSLTSARVGHHFAGPGNPFYRLLHAAGFVPEPITF